MVGVVATLIHYVVLESLFWFWQLLALANVAAFLIACAFSFTVQQRFTFRDRLQGKRLNCRALLLFFYRAQMAFKILSLVKIPIVVPYYGHSELNNL